MNPLRSVGARLSLALGIVVAGALGFVYLAVVPSLERNLVNAKLSQLERSAPSLASQLPLEPGLLFEDFVETGSASANARVVVFQIARQFPPAVSTYADSNDVRSEDVENDPVALRAVESFELARGVVSSDGDRFAEVAVPVPDGFVVLLRAPLRDSLANVDLVRRRLLLAGLLALGASLVVGFGAASLFARRLRRLERAADRIASGEFGEPIEDTGADELGQLARGFERMRGRLAQLDHARSEFIANASHELRTPLFSLGGFLELLTDEELEPATRREFLETMREQVERLTRLATDLLDLSRLDAGRLRIDAEPIDLAECARTIADEFRGLAAAGQHTLELSVAGEVPALGDPERTLQIGRTLIENALRHTPPGTTIRVRAGSADGGAALEVEDDGPGIPPEHGPHVFERFYRVDGAVASGSGLGLAIARELAELMGGSIELESRPGRTVFVLTLPTSRLEAALPAEPVGVPG